MKFNCHSKIRNDYKKGVGLNKYRFLTLKALGDMGLKEQNIVAC